MAAAMVYTVATEEAVMPKSNWPTQTDEKDSVATGMGQSGRGGDIPRGRASETLTPLPMRTTGWSKSAVSLRKRGSSHFWTEYGWKLKE